MPKGPTKRKKAWNRTKPRPAHQGRGNDPFYKSTRWVKTRKALFEKWAKEHLTAAMDLYQDHDTEVTVKDLNEWIDSGKPLCANCREKGRIRPATVCDHITARIEGGAEYSEKNLQPLCSSCHNRKSAKERTK